MKLPARVMCWYGDDFTGSTDVLEALAPHMPAVLFLERPDDAVFCTVRGLRGVRAGGFEPQPNAGVDG